jgi:hypothetical protein
MQRWEFIDEKNMKWIEKGERVNWGLKLKLSKETMLKPTPHLGLPKCCLFSRSSKYRSASATLLTSCCSWPGFAFVASVLKATRANTMRTNRPIKCLILFCTWEWKWKYKRRLPLFSTYHDKSLERLNLIKYWNQKTVFSEKWEKRFNKAIKSLKAKPFCYFSYKRLNHLFVTLYLP